MQARLHELEAADELKGAGVVAVLAASGDGPARVHLELQVCVGERVDGRTMDFGCCLAPVSARRKKDLGWQRLDRERGRDWIHREGIGISPFTFPFNSFSNLACILIFSFVAYGCGCCPVGAMVVRADRHSSNDAGKPLGRGGRCENEAGAGGGDVS